MVPKAGIFIGAFFLFFGLAGQADAGLTASLQSADKKTQVIVSAKGLKNINASKVKRATLKRQGAVFSLRAVAKKTWVSSRFRQPTVLDGFSGRKVSVNFKKNSGGWVSFSVLVKGTKNEDSINPINPIDPPSGVFAEGLVPAWSPDVDDYTLTCPKTVGVSINLPGPVSLDGGESQTGAFFRELDLSPGQAFTLSGDFGNQSFRCRPADLPLPSVSGKGSGSFYLVTPTIFSTGGLTNYAMVLDSNGVPVWWYKAPLPLILDMSMPLPGKFAWVQSRNGPGGFSSSDYTLQGLDGSFIDSLSPVGFGADHHDLQPTSDGGWFFIGYVPRNCPAVLSECIDLSSWGGPSQATAIDGWVQKIDRDGNVVWTWKSQDHIDLSESIDWIPSLGSGVRLSDGRRGYDIVHINSIEEDGDGFIFSARHLDGVYRVNNPAVDGSIDWKLGGTTTPESLTILGDPLSSHPLSGQHDARRLDDSTITIHENGTNRSRPPRMVRYSIDPFLKTAELVTAFSDPDVAGSGCCGGGRVLPDGSGWAVSWGASDVIGEYDLSGNRRLKMVWPEHRHSYRVVPVNPVDLSLDSLRAGMNSQFP